MKRFPWLSAAWLAAIVTIAGLAPWLTQEEPLLVVSGHILVPALWPTPPEHSFRDLDSPPPTPPSARHPMGTDDRGRDVLSRTIHGFRSALFFSIVTWVSTVLLGYLVGFLQGYFGGAIDFWGQRVTEAIGALPVYLLLALITTRYSQSLWTLAGGLICIRWVALSPVVRAETLQLRQQEFISAARAAGMSPWRIVARHIFPNALGPVVVYSPVLLASGFSMLIALDFLGMGIPPPSPSLGELLREGRENFDCWWLTFFPMAGISFVLFSVHRLGDYFRRGIPLSGHDQPKRPSTYWAVLGFFGVRKSEAVGPCSTISPISIKIDSSDTRRA